jgi:exopolysaccharide production protein ExoZ
VTERQSLVGVQYVRAVAALCVAFYHCSIQVPSLTPYFYRYLGMSLNYPAGVDVFFVVSGLIMYLTGRHLRPGEFLARRITRIVPLYWILTLLVSLLLLIQPELFRTTVVTGTYLLKSLLFIPYRNPGHAGDVTPILVPGWSLNMEMFFYLIFAGLLALPARALLWSATAVFLLLWVVHGVVSQYEGFTAIAFLTGARNFEFLAGMAIGYLYARGGLRAPRWLLLALFFGAAYVLLAHSRVVDNDDFDFLLTTIAPSALIVLAVVCWERCYGIPRIRPLVYLGDASYSIYLSHILALGVARFMWVRLGLAHQSGLAAGGFAIFSMIAVLVASTGVYSLLERPITQTLHHWRGQPPSAVLVPTRSSSERAAPAS